MSRKLYPTIENKKDHLECIDADIAPYRFEYNDIDKAIKYLVENGYVVIKNVLNKSEVAKGLSLLWEFLESKDVGWSKTDYKTWDVNKIGGKTQAGLLWGKGISNTKFQWFGRKHEKVRNIFANLWNHELFPNENNNKNNDPDTDLLTSLGGVCMFTPWYLSDKTENKTTSGWYHIDQNVAAKKGIHTIQGYIAYYDQNESTGSTVFIPKTHLLIQNYTKEYQIYDWMGDYVRLSRQNEQDAPLLNSKLYKKILLCTKSGDMVLWDSRTIHCNSPALLSIDEMRKIHLIFAKKNNSKVLKSNTLCLIQQLIDRFDDNGKNETYVDNVELLRLVSMICMVPKSRLTDTNILKQRINAYNNNFTLSHWPNESEILNKPKNIKQVDIENADKLTKSLVGFT